MKYVVGVIAFVFVFLGVLFIVSIGLAMLFPIEGRELNILSNWRGWIALVLAFLAAWQSWKSSVNR